VGAAVRLLVTSAHPTLLRYPHAHLGRLVQPRHYSSVEATALSGMPWAADNDCFQQLDALAFTAMLDRIRGLPGCLFVTVPDVVGDARATADLFELWAPALERRGLPVALVAQDGLELLPGWLAGQWHRIDALFIGGTTRWKMSDAARSLVDAARDRGKWVHMGRVNSLRRLMYARSIGCDSADGSKFSRWRDTYLPHVLTWLAEGEQLALEGAA
jgi:hypothetical protein